MPRVQKPPRPPEYDDDEEYDDEEYDVGDIVDEVLEHPKVRNIFQSIAHVIDRAGHVVDYVSRRQGMGSSGAGSGATNPRSQRPQAPQPRPINPYIVMGFDPKAVLTIEMIKARRKQLALIFHTDTGTGYHESITRLNAAADMLLKKVGGK